MTEPEMPEEMFSIVKMFMNIHPDTDFDTVFGDAFVTKETAQALRVSYQLINYVKNRADKSDEKDTEVERLRAISLEFMHQHSKLICGTYEYQCGFLDALKIAKDYLSGVKGESDGTT